MAVFSTNSLDNLGDSKVANYLYKLNEDLTYMFNNLTPEDNYSQTAQISYAKIVYNDNIVGEINASEEGISILADKISLEGLVTVNGNFKVLEDGSIEATNGKFNGTLNSTIINGGNNIPFNCRRGYVNIGDFYVGDEYGRHILQSFDECTGMSTGDADEGEWLLWAGYGYGNGDENTIFYINKGGQVYIEGSLYVNGKKIG